MRKLALFVLGCALAAAAQSPVTVKLEPAAPYIERSGQTQYLLNDFQLTNAGAAPLELVSIRMRAYDHAGRLVLWKKIDSNGSRPSAETLGQHRLEPGSTLTVFNPFARFETAAPVEKLHYDFDFMSKGGRVSIPAEVTPTVYQQKTRLIVPVRGVALWAYDGPDYLSHHRRLDLTDPMNRDVFKLQHNSQRYALDLVVLDAKDQAWQGDMSDKKNWVGFGTPIVAPADGTVLEAVGDLPDDIPFDEDAMKKNPALEAGNHILIDHGNGEFSMMAHFQQGSLVVKKGDRVRQGQVIGRMSRSGMGSMLVHVHYQLQNGPDPNTAEALPMEFDDVQPVGAAKAARSRIDAGWIIVTKK